MTKVKLSEYFDIKQAIQNDKMNFKILNINEVNSIPFLGRSALNNGIVDYVEENKISINDGGIITIALDGSTGATFYQHHAFSSGQNIWCLHPKSKYFESFNQIIALFCVTSLRKAVASYVGSYNLSLSKTRLTNNIEILLPLNSNKTVNIQYINTIMQELRNINLLKELPKNRYFNV